MGIIAPPSLFSALAITVGEHEQAAVDLQSGMHIRLLPSPVLGFPLAPFGLWRIRVSKDFERQTVRKREGDVDRIWIAPPSSPDTRDIGVEILPEAFHARAKINVLDGANRVVARRSGFPWQIAFPSPRRLLAVEAGNIEAINIYCVSENAVIETILGQDFAEVLSLPVEGRLPWYADGAGKDPAFERIRHGAPKQLTPLDRPEGDFEDVSDRDEFARVMQHATEPRGGIDKTLERLLGERDPPWDRHLEEVIEARDEAPWQKIDIALQNTLLMQAMDPGIARYLGLMTRREEQQQEDPSAWIAAGIFAVDPRRPFGRRQLGDILGPVDRREQRIIESFMGRFPALRDIIVDAQNIAEPGSLDIRAFATVTLAPLPPDRPEFISSPTLGPTRWMAPDGNEPSVAFRQDFLFPDLPPLVAIAAMSRQEGGSFVPRQQMIELADPDTTFHIRAVPLLIGTQQTLAAGTVGTVGLAIDSPLPADIASQYRFHLSDMFGRFGDPTDIDVPSPARPRPPAPVVQLDVIRAVAQHGAGGAVSPGILNARAPVPSVQHLASGALPIAGFEFTVDGVWRPQIPIAADIVEEHVNLQGIGPGEMLRVAVSALFLDEAGTPSLPWSETVEITDGRRPDVIETALGIVWSSRPGPAPEVELKLAWRARHPGEQYRAYLADVQSFGINGPSRAAIARAAGELQHEGGLAGVEKRKLFRLLTDKPLTADANQRVVLDQRLPRSLSTVQLLRVVPLSSAGVEADFDGCGLVPVAVPTDRKPPPPRLTNRTIPGSSVVTLVIEAVGLDLVELRASEPGLFSNSPGIGVPPEYRLRRTSGKNNDPVYAREVQRGPLQRFDQDNATLFRAEITDPSEGTLRPYVAYTYFAEVRMPPERRVIGPIEAPIADGIAPLEPAQASDMPRPFSAISAPVTVTVFPAEVPVLDNLQNPVTIESEAGSVHIHLTLAEPPPSHFRLRIWQQWGDEDIVAIQDLIDLNATPFVWQSDVRPVAAAPTHASLLLALVDPLGRQGKVIRYNSA